jgi:hypothetical protein
MPRSAYCRIEELGPLRLRGARAGSDLRGLAGRHEYQALAERTVGQIAENNTTLPVKFHGRIISQRILRWERKTV